MDSLKNILGKKMNRSPIAKQVAAALAVEAFAAAASGILGGNVGKRTQALYIKDGILTVACLSSVMAQELQLHQGEIIAALNKRLGKSMVSSMRFLQ